MVWNKITGGNAPISEWQKRPQNHVGYIRSSLHYDNQLNQINRFYTDQLCDEQARIYAAYTVLAYNPRMLSIQNMPVNIIYDCVLKFLPVRYTISCRNKHCKWSIKTSEHKLI